VVLMPLRANLSLCLIPGLVSRAQDFSSFSLRGIVSECFALPMKVSLLVLV